MKAYIFYAGLLQARIKNIQMAIFHTGCGVAPPDIKPFPIICPLIFRMASPCGRPAPPNSPRAP